MVHGLTPFGAGELERCCRKKERGEGIVAIGAMKLGYEKSEGAKWEGDGNNRRRI